MPEVGDPLDAHPERESLETLRIEAAMPKDHRMDHSGTQDRHPSGPLAGRAADAAADKASDVERDRRLGERVVARPEAGPLAGPEHGLGELVEEALEIAQRRALVDHQALDLEELEVPDGGDVLGAE